MHNKIEPKPGYGVILFINAFLVIVSVNSISVSLFATSQSKKQRSTCSAGEVVEFLYNDHFKRWKDSEEAKLNTKKKWLSTKLFDLFTLELKRPRNKDKVPYLDGDPFTHSQENPKTFRLGKAICLGSTAKVKVEFAYDGSFKDWVTVDLIFQDSTWRINNIRYRGGHDLQSDLKHK